MDLFESAGHVEKDVPHLVFCQQLCCVVLSFKFNKVLVEIATLTEFWPNIQNARLFPCLVELHAIVLVVILIGFMRLIRNSECLLDLLHLDISISVSQVLIFWLFYCIEFAISFRPYSKSFAETSFANLTFNNELIGKLFFFRWSANYLLFVEDPNIGNWWIQLAFSFSAAFLGSNWLKLWMAALSPEFGSEPVLWET